LHTSTAAVHPATVHWLTGVTTKREQVQELAVCDLGLKLSSWRLDITFIQAGMYCGKDAFQLASANA
jgi:hypothetical protein